MLKNCHVFDQRNASLLNKSIHFFKNKNKKNQISSLSQTDTKVSWTQLDSIGHLHEFCRIEMLAFVICIN